MAEKAIDFSISKVWIVGKLRAWIRTVAERQEEEALTAVGFLRALDE